MPVRTRVLAIGGVVGPAAFVTAWAVGGRQLDGYSPVDDAISRLAADGASTRWLMTAGFVAYGAGVAAYAGALRRTVAGPAWVAALTSAVATLGVAATPLDSGVDGLHALSAGLGYAALAATPALAARPLGRRNPRAAAASLAASAVGGMCLVATVVVPDHSGLFQRLGLTVLDTWLVLSAAAVAAGRLGPEVGSG